MLLAKKGYLTYAFESRLGRCAKIVYLPSSIAGEPPEFDEGGNAVPLIVIRLTGSDVVIVCMAFPAYIVLTNSLSPLIPIISDIGATSSLAAILGMRLY